MKILKFDMYLDGGTIEIQTDIGNFFLDHRLLSPTEGYWFDGYPENVFSEMLGGREIEMLERDLVISLKGYKHENYQNSIDNLLEALEAKYPIEEKKKIMIDMDDVTCDYKTRFLQKQEENPFISWPPAEYGFFRDLDPIQDAIESINILRTKYDVYFLTRPSVKNPMCYTEKRDWVGRYFDYEMCEKLILCYHKHLVMGDYLIDDNIHPGFIGKHIHFGQGEFKTWKQVLEYLM